MKSLNFNGGWFHWRYVREKFFPQISRRVFETLNSGKNRSRPEIEGNSNILNEILVITELVKLVMVMGKFKPFLKNTLMHILATSTQ